mmetsp:Transcript_53207/g.163700  ORF Transcript_53207/g.163700 Transcript_53207/m.163700 type:complete len:257 (-) Transcript_53207:196-966(-)
MNVRSQVGGKVVVDHNPDTTEIKASACDIRGEQKVYGTGSERFECGRAFLDGLCTLQLVRLQVTEFRKSRKCVEQCRQSVYRGAILREDKYARAAVVVAARRDQKGCLRSSDSRGLLRCIGVPGGAGHIHRCGIVLNAHEVLTKLRRKRHMSNVDVLDLGVEVRGCEFVHCTSHGCGEETDLRRLDAVVFRGQRPPSPGHRRPTANNSLGDVFDLIDQFWRHQFVDFVKHNDFKPAHVQKVACTIRRRFCNCRGRF